jgi:predicted metalloprotease
MGAGTQRRYSRHGTDARGRQLLRIVAVAFAVAVLASLLRTMPRQAAAPAATPDRAAAARDERDARHVALLTAMVRDVEATWRRQLPQVGTAYTDVRLVVGRDASTPACPDAVPDTDSRYCAADATVLLDLDATAALDPAAQSFVVAHAVGHHVAALLHGAGDLQADCLTGVWASLTSRSDLLPPDRVPGVLASLAPRSRQPVARRLAAFRRGYEAGDPLACVDARAPLAD